MSNVGDILRHLQTDPLLSESQLSPKDALALMGGELAGAVIAVNAAGESYNPVRRHLIFIACLALKGLAQCERLESETMLAEQLPGYATCLELADMAAEHNIAAYRVDMRDEKDQESSVIAFPGTTRTNLFLRMLETLNGLDPAVMRQEAQEVITAILRARGRACTEAGRAR